MDLKVNRSDLGYDQNPNWVPFSVFGSGVDLGMLEHIHREEYEGRGSRSPPSKFNTREREAGFDASGGTFAEEAPSRGGDHWPRRISLGDEAAYVEEQR